MTPMERMFRHQIAAERLQQIAGEIAATGDSLYRNGCRIGNDSELEYLTRAEDALRNAVRALEDAQAEARLQCQPELLGHQLRASLELVGRSPERMRAEAEGQ